MKVAAAVLLLALASVTAPTSASINLVSAQSSFMDDPAPPPADCQPDSTDPTCQPPPPTPPPSHHGHNYFL